MELLLSIIIIIGAIYFASVSSGQSQEYKDTNHYDYSRSSYISDRKSQAVESLQLTCLTKWNASVFIGVYKDCLEINYEKTPWNKITNVTIQTESQIQKDVSAGKILAFGALALASKKTKTVTERFLVITCINEFTQEENIVLYEGNKKDCSVDFAREQIVKAYKRFKPTCY